VALLSSATHSTAVASYCWMGGAQRAAVSNFGGHLTLADTTLECNSIQLDGEPAPGFATEFVDGGGNQCGCGDAPATCQATSAGLAPPAPLMAPK